MNLVVLSGRAVDRPELKQGRKQQFCTFTIAVRRPFAKSKMSNTPKVDFLDCIAFGRQAVNLRRHLPKGGLIQIQGSLETYKVEVDGRFFKKHVISVQNSDLINWRNAEDGTDNIRVRLEDVAIDTVPSELEGMLDLHKANKRRTAPDVEMVSTSKMAGGEDDPYMVGLDISMADELFDLIPYSEQMEHEYEEQGEE